MYVLLFEVELNYGSNVYSMKFAQKMALIKWMLVSFTVLQFQ